jgi:hypothetical protein
MHDLVVRSWSAAALSIFAVCLAAAEAPAAERDAKRVLFAGPVLRDATDVMKHFPAPSRELPAGGPSVPGAATRTAPTEAAYLLPAGPTGARAMSPRAVPYGLPAGPALSGIPRPAMPSPDVPVMPAGPVAPNDGSVIPHDLP